MFEEILFPTDGSDAANVALDHALDVAAAHDATLHVLNVADTRQDSVVRIQGEVVDALEEEGEDIVAEAADRASERGVSTVTEVLQGEPYSTIVDYADTRAIDLVVMSTRGRGGLGRLILGSTTDRVVRQCEAPVLTIRPDDEVRYPYENVLVPTDGSDTADAALDLGIDLATSGNAALHVLSVVDTAALGVDVRTDMQVDALEESAEKLVESAERKATDAGVETVSGTVEFAASVSRAIQSYVADHDVDLVVMGTHGRSGLERVLLGSVTERMIRTASVPVLTVRDRAED